MSHKLGMIIIGCLIILLGLIVHYGSGSSHSIYISVASHFFIILGEAILVMFFLHVVIEEKNHDNFVKSHKKSIAEFQEDSMELLTLQTTETKRAFGDLFKDVNTQVTTTIENIKDDLFIAILKDRMPHDMVKPILDSNFFKPTFLRRNLFVKYQYMECVGEILRVKQRIEFDMSYVVGTEDEIDYDMPFNLSDSPLAKYKFISAGIRTYWNNRLRNDLKTFAEADFEKIELGDNKEKDYFRLKAPLKIKKNETIHVYQEIMDIFTLQESGIVDNYFVNNHTIIATIEVTDFPPDFEFNIYPTFPEENLPKPIIMGNRKTYENINFLIPGQGFGYSILRKK